MSEEYNADFIAGYGDGVLNLAKQKSTADYIAGYEMGMRLRERKRVAPPQQSKQAPFEIPGTHPDYRKGFIDGTNDAKNIGLPKNPTKNTVYNDGYEIGFGSVIINIPSEDELAKIMDGAENDFVRDTFKAFNKGGKSKTKKGGKSKRGGGKSKKRGGKTKKRNQKK
jgi:hypothetical protein